MYYDRWLESWAMNDVLVTTFYTGKLFYLYWDFDMIVYYPIEDPSIDWYHYYPYLPPNLRDAKYYIDRGMEVPDHLQVHTNVSTPHVNVTSSKP